MSGIEADSLGSIGVVIYLGVAKCIVTVQWECFLLLDPSRWLMTRLQREGFRFSSVLRSMAPGLHAPLCIVFRRRVSFVISMFVFLLFSGVIFFKLKALWGRMHGHPFWRYSTQGLRQNRAKYIFVGIYCIWLGERIPWISDIVLTDLLKQNPYSLF